MSELVSLIGLQKQEIEQLKNENAKIISKANAYNKLIIIANERLDKIELLEQKLEKIKEYCIKNKHSGWIDIEGIVEIIEEKTNEG